MPGFSAVITYGLAAPAGTPRAIVERLNKELRVALAEPACANGSMLKAARSCPAHRGLRQHRQRREEVGPAGEEPQLKVE